MSAARVTDRDSDVLRVLFLSTSYPADATDWRGVFMRHLVAALARRDDLLLAVWAPPNGLSPAAAPRVRLTLH
jgi:hypothetical protein